LKLPPPVLDATAAGIRPQVNQKPRKILIYVLVLHFLSLSSFLHIFPFDPR
jgi:hypothetical protein